jgi:hypothetical protein
MLGDARRCTLRLFDRHENVAAGMMEWLREARLACDGGRRRLNFRAILAPRLLAV